MFTSTNRTAADTTTSRFRGVLGIHSVEVQDGAHPDGMKYRPPSTGKYVSDNIGHWAVFWELDSLERIGERQHRPDCMIRRRDSHGN
jgi:hypothetical protein